MVDLNWDTAEVGGDVFGGYMTLATVPHADVMAGRKPHTKSLLHLAVDSYTRRCLAIELPVRADAASVCDVAWRLTDRTQQAIPLFLGLARQFSPECTSSTYRTAREGQVSFLERDGASDIVVAINGGGGCNSDTVEGEKTQAKNGARVSGGEHIKAPFVVELQPSWAERKCTGGIKRRLGSKPTSPRPRPDGRRDRTAYI